MGVAASKKEVRVKIVYPNLQKPKKTAGVNNFGGDFHALTEG